MSYIFDTTPTTRLTECGNLMGTMPRSAMSKKHNAFFLASYSMC